MSKQLKVNVTYTGKSDSVVASEAVAAVDGSFSATAFAACIGKLARHRIGKLDRYSQIKAPPSGALRIAN